MQRASAIVASLIAILLLVLGPFAFAPQPVSADVGIKGQWTTLANGDDIRGLAVTLTHVWAGTHNGGVVSWEFDGGSRTQYLAPQTSIASNDIRAVASNNYDFVWFATNKGVSQLEIVEPKRWTTYTTADGLASNNATAVAYGTDGRLWVGTSQTWTGSEWVGGGLSVCELNGDCFSYTVVDGLPSNNIADIAFVGSEVWVGTKPYKVFVEETNTTAAHWVDEGGGVALLSDGQWKPFTKENSNLTDNRINAVATAPDGHVWFATPSGLVVYDPANESWRTYRTHDGLESNAVRDVVLDSSNRVWATTYKSESTPVGALNKLEGGTWTVYDDDDGLSSKVLWSVLADDQGRVWIGTGPWCKDKTGCQGGGLTQYRPVENAWQVHRMADSHLVSNQITDVAVTNSGALWVTTRGSGVSMRDEAGAWHHFTMEDGDLASNIVSTVAIDKDGAVWIGTQQYVKEGAWAGGGVNVYRDGVWTIYNKDNSALPVNEVLKIETDADGLVWIGTGDLRDNSGAGLAIYDPAIDDPDVAWTVYTVDDGLPSNLVTDVAFDREHDRVWVAMGPYLVGGITGGGLAVFENGGWTSFTSANDVPTWNDDNVTGDFRAIVVDNDGNPWAGTYDTQGYLSEEWPFVDALIAHREGDQWSKIPFPEQGFISSLLLAPNGTLWAGIGQGGRGDLPTRGGLRARINGTWTAATMATSGLAGNDITTLALGSNGDLWIGTADAGLSLLQNAQPGPTPTKTPPPTNTPEPTSTPGVAPSITNTPVPVTPTPGNVSPPAEIPEAATLVLVGTGLAGLGGYAAYRWRLRNEKREA
ncbi:MAG: two-component regulator propeller domain-containing protein [Anaerolineae bacterium]